MLLGATCIPDQRLEYLASALQEEHGALTIAGDVADDRDEVAACLIVVLLAQDGLLNLIQNALAETLTAARDLAYSHVCHVALAFVLEQRTTGTVLLIHEQV